MSSQAETSQRTTTARPVRGGRACPLPAGLSSSVSPFKARQQRRLASTGVITADVLGRAD